MEMGMPMQSPSRALSVDEDLLVRQLHRRAVDNVSLQNLSQRQRSQAFFSFLKVVNSPPAKAIHDFRLLNIGHRRLEPINVNNHIFFALGYSSCAPSENVVPAPDHRAGKKICEAEFFSKLTSQSLFDCLALLQSTARCNPEMFRPIRWTDSDEEHLMIWGQNEAADRLSLHQQVDLSIVQGVTVRGTRAILYAAALNREQPIAARGTKGRFQALEPKTTRVLLTAK
jgi:hypothetical protein